MDRRDREGGWPNNALRRPLVMVLLNYGFCYLRKIFLPYKLMHHDVYRLAVGIVLFVLLWWNLPNRALKILDLVEFFGFTPR